MDSILYAFLIFVGIVVFFILSHFVQKYFKSFIFAVFLVAMFAIVLPSTGAWLILRGVGEGGWLGGFFVFAGLPLLAVSGLVLWEFAKTHVLRSSSKDE